MKIRSLAYLCVLLWAPIAFGAGLPQENKTDPGLGDFITPNEPEFYRFSAPLEQSKDGALLAVGTFRAFQDASVGSFSQAYFVDYDSLIVSYNRCLLNLLKQSQDRYTYLVQLLNTPDAPELREQLKKFEKGKITPEAFTYWVSTHMSDSPPKWLLPFLRVAPDSPYRRTGLDRWKDFRTEVIRMITSEHQYSEAFFGSDDRFERVKNLAQAGKIHILQADISGDQTLPAIARQLKQEKVPISVVDISNAIDYVNTKEARAQFVANLRDLPLDENSKVFIVALETKPHESHWNYHSIPLRQYADTLEAVNQRFEGLGWNFPGVLYTNLAQNSKPLPIPQSKPRCVRSFLRRIFELR